MGDAGHMDHSGHMMDHSGHMADLSGHTMDHSEHAGPAVMDAARTVVNATLSAAASAAGTVQQHLHGTADSGHDHAAMGHDHAAMGHGQGGHMAAAAGPAAHSMAGGGHGMAMTFHFGVSEFVLFDAWHVTTAGGMAASCVGLFILALLYEGLKYKREDLLRRNATRNQFETIRVPTDGGVTEVTTVSNSQHMLSKHHILQTFLHAVQVVVGYFLMLAFMTYNVWLGMAIVLGAAAGYFIFGSKKFVVVDVTEHCH